VLVEPGEEQSVLPLSYRLAFRPELSRVSQPPWCDMWMRLLARYVQQEWPEPMESSS
jgi:hypothetical protein